MKQDINKATIVDVRTPDEFASGHVPGAINIPLNELAGRVSELKVSGKPVVAYCRTGNRSEIAVVMLQQGGIADAVNGGGLQDMMQGNKI